MNHNNEKEQRPVSRNYSKFFTGVLMFTISILYAVFEFYKEGMFTLIIAFYIFESLYYEDKCKKILSLALGRDINKQDLEEPFDSLAEKMKIRNGGK